MPNVWTTVQPMSTGPQWNVWADQNLGKALTGAMKDRISIGDVDKVMKWLEDGFQGKKQYGANEVELTRMAIRAAMRDSGYKINGKSVIHGNTDIHIAGKQVEFTGPKAAKKFLHEVFSFFGQLGADKVEKKLSKATAGNKTRAQQEAKEIATAVVQETTLSPADAAKKLIAVMKEAEALRPKYDYDMRGSVDAMTMRSLERFGSRNGLKKDIKLAATQVYRNLFSRATARQVNEYNRRHEGHGHGEREMPTGQAFTRQLKWSWIRTTDADWRALEKQAVQWVTADRPGKAAKAILKAVDELSELDVTKLISEKEQAKVFQTMIGVMFNRSGVARGGRVNWDGVAKYFRTTQGKKHTAAFKKLTNKAFFWLTKSMPNARRNPPSLCADQAGAAMEQLMSLKPTSRANSIYALAEATTKKGIYRS